MRKLQLILFLTVLLAAGCNGWDDDSVYAIHTRAAFFVVEDGTNRHLVRLAEDRLSMDWNASTGVPTGRLGDAIMVENMVWLSDVESNSVIEYDPVQGSSERKYTGLPIRPHRFAVGRTQLFVMDTIANKIAFVRLRNGDVISPEYMGLPQSVRYNNNRFYLQQNDREIAVYDEQALATRAIIPIDGRIEGTYFDKNYSLRVINVDTAGIRYTAIIGGNADYVAIPNYVVDLDMVRYTPYLNVRFGNEVTDDLQLRDGNLETLLLAPLLDSVQDFEADFFDGQVYAKRGDSLLQYSVRLDSVVAKWHFPYQLESAFFQYGGGD